MHKNETCSNMVKRVSRLSVVSNHVDFYDCVLLLGKYDKSWAVFPGLLSFSSLFVEIAASS